MNNEQKEQMIKTNAFDGVSFDPEKRLERFISDIESEDNKIDELCQQYGRGAWTRGAKTITVETVKKILGRKMKFCDERIQK